jgi:hypothetical protein
MLHEFVSSNRQELIRRCREKASSRFSPSNTSLQLEHGVPLFLTQLVEALCYERTNPEALHGGILGSSDIASAESSRTAALHGKELLREGYTVDHVVHGYGDVCQAVTELAKERNEPVTIGEFHTFNRLLDNAIADAVSSYADHRECLSAQGAQDLHERLGTLADEQRALLDAVLKALNALKVGNLGVTGATGTFLEDSLIKLRDLIDRSLPEIRLSSGMITPPKEGDGRNA